VLVPTGVSKAVNDPGRGQAAAYVAPNGAGGEWRVVSLSEFREATGIDAFPGPLAAAKDWPMDLPAPPSRGAADGGPRRRKAPAAVAGVRVESDLPGSRAWAWAG
jgi:endonuclease G